MDNAEITALKKILGLQTGKHYDNADSLRYGRVMIMADQDHDGVFCATPPTPMLAVDIRNSNDWRY
jgi:DNA gyrase/topoisomerase IV subunit B